MKKSNRNELFIAISCIFIILLHGIDIITSKELTPMFFISRGLLLFIIIYVFVIDENYLHRFFLLLNVVSIISGILKLYHFQYSDYGVMIGLLDTIVIIVILIRQVYFTGKDSGFTQPSAIVFSAVAILSLAAFPFGKNIQNVLNLCLIGVAVILYSLFRKKHLDINLLILIYVTQACFSIINYFA